MSKGRYGCKAALFMAVTVTLSGLAGFGGSRVGRAVWGEGDGGVGLSFSQASPDAADPLGGLALPAMDGGEDQSGGSSELRLTGHAYDGSEAMPMDGWAQPGDVMGVGGEPAIPGLERLAAAASEALRASAYAKGNAEGPDGPMPLSIPEIASMNLDRVVEVYVEFPAGGGRSGQTNATGAGSGVIISADGYIVTNNHVIEGARKVTVRLSSGVRHEAAVVGGDEGSDIAVIKIGARRLQPAVYGDSDYLVVGELAIAIGNPLGLLGGTVTEGIISALDRKVEVEGLSMCLIQTSAAVNPGNSGGGLFNSGGELIGIVNAKSSGQDVEGIGFAIPVNLVREIAEAIIRYGYYPGRLDIGAELSEVAEASNVSGQSSPTPGVYVSKADAGGGLHVSDRVVKVAGIPVSSLSDVYGELGRHLPGVVTFTVVRGGRDVNVRVTVRLAG